MLHLKNSQIVALCLAVPLMVIWSIPNSVALRNVLLGLLCLTVLTSGTSRRAIQHQLFNSAEGRSYLLLTAWLMLQALAWAWFPGETWAELKGQWLKGMMIFVTGIGFSALLAEGRPDARRALLAVYAALGTAVLLQLIDYLWEWGAHGRPPMNSDGIFRGKVQVSYLANLFFGMTMAEIFSRICQVREMFPFSMAKLIAAAAMAVLVVILSGARNGMIGLILLFGSTALLAWWFAPHQLSGRGRWRWPALAAVCVLGLAAASWKLDPRWQQFDDTVAYALKPDTYKAWLDARKYPYPVMSNGQVVDASAYERLSFITVGLTMARHLPLGLGYTRQAFSHAVKAQYGERSKHAHSGFIEYLIAMGWPGLAGWFVFLGLALRRAVRAFLHDSNCLGLVTAFLVTGFAGRMMIENITRDHMLEMFLFLLGLLLSALHFEQSRQGSPVGTTDLRK